MRKIAELFPVRGGRRHLRPSVWVLSSTHTTGGAAPPDGTGGSTPTLKSKMRMSSQPVITLYDTPATVPLPWSPNIWRIRFILNYKRLNYRTVWVDFPDIEPTMRNIGAPPSSVRHDGQPVYTLPVIYDSRIPGRPIILSNVTTITEYLELEHPARPLFPEGTRAVQSLFVHHIQESLARPLLPILVPLSYQRLSPRGQQHFRGPHRAVMPGPLVPGPQLEQHWAAVKQQFDFLASIMDKNSTDGSGDGMVTMGREITYADFVLCSVLLWIEQVAPHDGWARVRQWNGGRWSRLMERCRDYMDIC